MRVAIATDHAGVGLLQITVDAVRDAGHEPLVIGQATEGDDYPDVALAVGAALRTGQAQRGIALCGSGAGVTVAANKIPLVRAALAYDTYTARQMVQHDDVNVLALGARVIGPAVAADVVDAFIGATFSGVERHARRLGKILAIEATRVRGAAADLVARGQRLWLDGVVAPLLDDGRMAAWVADHAVSGATSAVERLAGAVGEGLYDDRLAKQDPGDDAEALALALLLSDAGAAADLLGGVHAASGGTDGYASLDLPPRLSDDVDGMLDVARRLHALAARPNVMVKVPATRAGQTAIRRLVEDGIPVHVTLVYSAEQYRAVAQAYAAGVERRVRAGADPAVGAIVAVQVAPWDVATAERLADDLHHTVGLHVAGRVVDAAAEQREDAAWRALVGEGALPLRLGFAGIAAPDGLEPAFYVDEIDADQTTLIATPTTLRDLAGTDHLDGPSGRDGIDADTLSAAGVAIDALATRLQHDGLRRAEANWRALDAGLGAAAAEDGQ